MAENDFNLFILNTKTFGDQSRPDLARLSNGNIVVAWDSGDTRLDQFGEQNNEVRVAIFDAAGNIVVSEFVASQNPGLRNVHPEVVALASGFVVAWQTDSDTLVARFFDASGSALTSEFAISEPDLSNGTHEIKPLADGGFVATCGPLTTI